MVTEDPIRSWRSHEREFRLYANTFFKRCFRPDEYVPNIHGIPVVPPQRLDRLRNEAQCLEFIRANTNIPVPKVIEAYEDNDSFVLVTERVIGRQIEDLQPQDRKEMEGHVETLRSLRSSRPGGPTGIMCPSPRVVQKFPPGTNWSPQKGEEAEFGFCHCDLGWPNIIIDSDRPRIRAILDWEYAGFWPDYFELPFYHGLRGSGSQFVGAPEWTRVVAFSASQLEAAKEAKPE